MPRSTRPKRARPAGHGARAAGNGLLFPLDITYKRAGVALPDAWTVTPEDIPFPYRALLEHDQDMTLTLERFCGGPVCLRMLSSFRSGPWYQRRILLVDGVSGRPVEMGAVRIKLDAFKPRIRAEILRHDVPLGRLLRAGGIDFESRPRGFLALTPNSEMMGLFWMADPLTLYGRQTDVLIDGKKVGDIVEILPLV